MLAQNLKHRLIIIMFAGEPGSNGKDGIAGVPGERGPPGESKFHWMLIYSKRNKTVK